MLLSTCTRMARLGKAVLQTTGHVTCIAILSTTHLVTLTLNTTARWTTRLIAFITRADIDTDNLTPHKERYHTFQQKAPTDSDPALAHPLLSYRKNTGGNGVPNVEPFQVLDENETLRKVRDHFADRKQPLPDHFGNEEKLTELSHAIISSEFGCLDPELLADDFQFVFPVVGPLEKPEFIEAFSSFKVREAFPNARANFYNFKIDPLEPNRIWALSRGAYVQEGTLHFGPNVLKPSAKPERIHLPPQTFSFSFDDHGKLYKLTGGYCVDRAVGDTDGLGGMFGVLHAMGKTLPIPEAKPWNRSTRSLMWEAISLRVPQIVKDWRKACGRRTDEDVGNGNFVR